MSIHKPRLDLLRPRHYTWSDEYHYYPAVEGVYFVRISSYSYWLEKIVDEMPAPIFFPLFIGSIFRDKRLEKQVELNDLQFESGNTSELLKHPRSFLIKPSDLTQITLIKDKKMKKILKIGTLQFDFKDGKVFKFQFESDTQLDLVEELVTEHFFSVPIKRS